MNSDYEDYSALVEGLVQTYILCARQAGAIRTYSYGESELAEPEPVLDEFGRPKKSIQMQERSLPRVNAFAAKNFIADMDLLFDRVISNRPKLEPLIDSLLKEAADLEHDKIEPKQRAEAVLHIGRMAVRRKISPKTYFVTIKKRSL